MSPWPSIPISELGTVVTGSTPPTSDPSLYGEDVPFVTPAELDQSTPITSTQRWLSHAGANVARLLPSGSVMVSCIGTLGKTAIAGRAVVTNQQINSIIFDESRVIPRFGLYACRRLKPILETLAPATTLPIVSKSKFEQLCLLVPPLQVQQRIIAVLDKADAIRRKRQEAIALTEQLLRSTFLEMFGDPVTNPKRWPETLLGESLLARPQIGTTKPAHEDGKYPVVRVGELGNRDIPLEECGRITLEGAEFERFLCQPGDLLLARAIGSEEQLGKASLVGESGCPIVFDSHVMRLRFNRARVLPSFFYHWLASDGGRARFLRRAGRTAVQFNVNAEQISGVVLPLPPLAEQERWHRFERQALQTIRRLRTAESASLTLFQSLVQRAFSGQL